VAFVLLDTEGKLKPSSEIKKKKKTTNKLLLPEPNEG
jgi:hypothetical protein